MERNVKKGSLLHLFESRKRKSGLKIAVAIVFLASGFGFSSQNIENGGFSVAFRQGIADSFGLNLNYHGLFYANDSFFPFSVGLVYQNLGQFVLSDSSDFAYNNVRIETATAYGLSLSAGFFIEQMKFSAWTFLLYQNLSYYHDFFANGGFQLEYFTPFASFEAGAGFTNETLFIEVGIRFPLLLKPLRIFPKLGYLYRGNHILTAGLLLANYDFGFSLSVDAKIGLNLPFYEWIVFEVYKEMPFLEGLAVSFSFSPSLFANNIYEVRLHWKL